MVRPSRFFVALVAAGAVWVADCLVGRPLLRPTRNLTVWPVRLGSVRCLLLVCVVFRLFSSPLFAEDWPQWRGPTRQGLWTETGIVERFPDNGLRVSWRVPVRAGFAGPVVADGRVFVLDYQEDAGSRRMDGAERLMCLDEETGDVLWTSEWPAAYLTTPHLRRGRVPRQA